MGLICSAPISPIGPIRSQRCGPSLPLTLQLVERFFEDEDEYENDGGLQPLYGLRLLIY
jgi:hypothetical protein